MCILTVQLVVLKGGVFAEFCDFIINEICTLPTNLSINKICNNLPKLPAIDNGQHLGYCDILYLHELTSGTNITQQ